MQLIIRLITTFLVISQSFSTKNDCNIVFQGIDLSTKVYRIEIAPAYLFSYTPKEIKNELKVDNLITSTGQLLQTDNTVALHLNLEISSLIAPQEYGSINQASELRITLISGKEVKLKCYAGSTGIKKKDNTGYIYPIGYELENKQLKQLLKSEIDKIGIQWSSGYEEYTIYEVDFFINQITCLQSAARPN